MRSDLETTRVVRSWLEEGRTRLPDSIADAVLHQLPATPQRRSRWPARRLADMNLAVKGLLAAAAVVAVTVIGINLLPAIGVGPGPAAPATPSPTPTPAPTATPPPLSSGSLDAGTYRWDDPLFTRLPFTLTVPDGWKHQAAEGNFVFTGASTASEAFEKDGVYLAAWIVSHVFAESCQWNGTLVETPTTDAVIAALTAQTGHEATGPAVTTLGGRPATRFEFSLPPTFDATACDSGIARLWPDAGPVLQYGLPIGPGQTTTVYVVDVDGKAQLIAAARGDGSSPADVTELDQVVASLDFDD